MTNYHEVKKILNKEQISSEDFMIVYDWIVRKYNFIKEQLRNADYRGLMRFRIKEDIDLLADVITELELNRNKLTQVVEKNIEDYLSAFRTKLEEVKELWRSGLR